MVRPPHVEHRPAALADERFIRPAVDPSGRRVGAAALKADELLLGLETLSAVPGTDRRRRCLGAVSPAQKVTEEEAGQLGYRESSLIRRGFQRRRLAAWDEERKFDHVPAEPIQRRWSNEASDPVRRHFLVVTRHSLASHRYPPFSFRTLWAPTCS